MQYACPDFRTLSQLPPGKKHDILMLQNKILDQKQPCKSLTAQKQRSNIVAHLRMGCEMTVVLTATPHCHLPVTSCSQHGPPSESISRRAQSVSTDRLGRDIHPSAGRLWPALLSVRDTPSGPVAAAARYRPHHTRPDRAATRWRQSLPACRSTSDPTQRPA